MASHMHTKAISLVSSLAAERKPPFVSISDNPRMVSKGLLVSCSRGPTPVGVRMSPSSRQETHHLALLNAYQQKSLQVDKIHFGIVRARHNRISKSEGNGAKARGVAMEWGRQ